MQLTGEALEHRRELRRILLAAVLGVDGDARRVSVVGGESDGPEVDVLDRPAVAGDRGDRHRQRRRVALPRDDGRRDVGLRAGEVLDGARDHARGAGGAELESAHEAASAASEPWTRY